SRVGAKSPTSLATQPGFAKARDLGRGRIGVYLRHPGSMGGGWSMAVADVRDDQLTIRHSGHFDAVPFSHDVTQLTCDFSPVKCFESRALIASIQPTDIGDGPMEAFVSATLHEGLISPAMRHNMGARRMLVVGEEDGWQFDRPIDMVTATCVSCIEHKEKVDAAAQLRQEMVSLAWTFNRLVQAGCLV